MSGDVVNFNKARKERAKAAAKERAAENRAKFSQTTAQRFVAALAKAREKRQLDGHKRDGKLDDA